MTVEPVCQGSACSIKNKSGTCRFINHCKPVYEELLAGHPLESICGYKHTLPIVCCPRDDGEISKVDPTTTTTTVSTSSNPFLLLTAPKKPTTTWTREENTDTNYKRVAERMCSIYARAVYELQQPPTLAAGDRHPVNVSLCAIKSKKLIIGGFKAVPKEFPHMAAIGYVSGGRVHWRCGGTLISDKFVLTAAHCVTSLNDPPRLVRVGDLNLYSRSDDSRPQNRRIVQIIKHPNYTLLYNYHDIALLKLLSPVKFNAYVRPACLSVAPKFSDNDKAIASGWGLIDILEEKKSEHLLKITLPIVSYEKCYYAYKYFKQRLPYGLDDNSQLCAGGQRDKDTCQGDSGGPLVTYNNKKKCMYDVIGVTSFGNGCGSIYPAIYTRVYNYVSWIESIVWPNLH